MLWWAPRLVPASVFIMEELSKSSLSLNDDVLSVKEMLQPMVDDVL